MTTESSKTNTILIIILLVIVGVVGYSIMNAPDNRSTGERVGDAVDKLDNGVGDAADQLGDRTPAQKLGDKIEETGDDIKSNSN